jgi:hypothetical protein
MSMKGMLLTAGLIGLAVTLAGMSMAYGGYDESILHYFGKWPADSMTIVGPFIIKTPMCLLCLIVPDTLFADMSPTWGYVIVILWSALIWAIVTFLPLFGWHQFKKRRLASEDLTSLPTNATKA